MITRSSSSTPASMRLDRSSLPARSAVPCRLIPTANSDWMTPSCNSLAIRSRSSSSVRSCSCCRAWANSTATDACAANVSTSSTSGSENGSAPIGFVTESVPRALPRTMSGMNMVGPIRVAATSPGSARRSSDAFSTMTGLASWITPPEIEPSIGTTVPRRSSIPGPSAATTESSPVSAGSTSHAIPAPTSSRACRTMSASASSTSPPARMAPVTSRIASSQRPRRSDSSYRRALTTATPAWAASTSRAVWSSSLNSAPPRFSVR